MHEGEVGIGILAASSALAKPVPRKFRLLDLLLWSPFAIVPLIMLWAVLFGAAWQTAMAIILGSFLLLMFSGVPVAFAFLLVNITGALILWNVEAGLRLSITGIYTSVAIFYLLPVTLFCLMGEVMFQSGIGPKMLDAIDKLIGRVPGRLALLAVAGGTLFGAMSGAGMASTAMLGSMLSPEMEARGYKKQMSLGPIMGSGGLAILVPPTTLGVIIAVIAEVSVGDLLVAIVVPGLVLAVAYAAYIIIRCSLDPSLAPPYEPSPTTRLDKLVSSIKYISPAALLIFLVVGVIFVGIATPTEAAALGCVGAFALAAVFRTLTWKMAWDSFTATTKISVMILLILAPSEVFSRILAFTGATQGLSRAMLGLPVAPIVTVLLMMLAMGILGCFMNGVPLMMVTIPIFMPVVKALGFDPIWFTAIALVNVEMAQITPPFGMNLFVMKAVAPEDTTMEDIWRAAYPFVLCEIGVIVLLVLVPGITTWLPGLMKAP